MVVRKISEMYDMRTTRGAIGIIGVHTPSATSIAKRWFGEFMTYRKYRVKSCTISLACAAQLPVDPLGVGTAAGQVAPQDMMNPILYRAVTNDSWNAAIGRLYASAGANPDTNSIRNFANGFSSLSAAQQENAYYAMLSSDEWRKALPQQGLVMKGLRPLAYEVLQVFGQGASGPVDTVDTIGSVYASTPTGNATSLAPAVSNPNSNRMIRGRARPFPAWPTSPIGVSYYTDPETGAVMTPYTTMASVPRTYVACILVPPASTAGSLFYYRMKIDWYIDFFEPVSILDRLNATNMASDGANTYTRYYSTDPTVSASANMLQAVPLDPEDGSDRTIDVVGTEEPTLIMEK